MDRLKTRRGALCNRFVTLDVAVVVAATFILSGAACRRTQDQQTKTGTVEGSASSTFSTASTSVKNTARTASPRDPAVAETAAASTDTAATELATATFGSGCFWCTEAVFSELRGVHSAVSGYSGGTVPNPTYKSVVSGETGHAEVIQVTYDPGVISYRELLDVFWHSHDPTTLNRQGADVGTQYRSVILYHDEEQKRLAEEVKAKLDASGEFGDPIVTQIAAFSEFYRAEESHQDFFARNGNQPYCRAVIRPKLEKFRLQFKSKLKP